MPILTIRGGESMAAMHYDGNFNAERGQLSAIDSTITRELAAMDQTLDGMNAYWKDEKSTEFISSTKDFIAQVRTKQAQAIQDGNNILTQVENALKIYEG